MSDAATIFVIDDDGSVRQGLSRLLRSSGYRTQTFVSAEAFLSQMPGAHPACIVLNVQLPGLDGLELQERLAVEGPHLPIIFITGHGDIRTTVRAMKMGAVDFLEKPVDEQDLLAAIDQALGKDRHLQDKRYEVQKLLARLNTLTKREFDVFQHVISGSLNKQIALKLFISEKTVKIHRGRVMAKLGVESIAELVCWPPKPTSNRLTKRAIPTVIPLLSTHPL